MILRRFTFILCIAVLLPLTACQPNASKENVFLVVDFKPQVPVKYKMVSERQSSVFLDSKSKKAKPDIVREKLELVISYKPVGGPDTYGLTTIEATCHSAKVTRTAKKSATGKDAVETLTGKSYTFKVTPTGKITDYTNLDKLAAELGSKAFYDGGKQGRIKNPDMIADFVTLQWHLWDSIAAAEQTSKGLAPGASWTKKQRIPLPVPIRFARDTTYTLGEKLPTTGPEDKADEKIVIDSSYSVGEGALENWPNIYTGRFNMKGTFGILRNFRLLSIDGTGKQIFNVERGLVEKDVQQYQAKFSTTMIFNLPGVAPAVTIDQKMSVELLDN